jgi:AcrR family transcriptional regulator
MASTKVKLTKKSVTDTTARGDRTRQQIKKVIAELANKKELSEITLADICKATKLTTGAVYFHFSGRDEAIEEMVIDEVKALYAEQLAGSSESFESFVAAIIDANTRYNLKNKQMPRAIATAIFSKPRVYQAWLEARRPVVEQLQSLIAQKREKQSLPVSDAPYLAHFILNSIEDLAIDVFQWANPALEHFAADPNSWRDRQTKMWAWTILAPFDSIAPSTKGAPRD